MSIKSQSNYRYPLFTSFDVQDDKTILILYHRSMKEETETIVVHLLVYLEAVFGSDIYQLFTNEHRHKMSQFIYCSEVKRVIDIPDHPDNSLIDYTEYTLSAIGDRFGVPNILGNISDVPKIQFDLPH